MEHAAIIQIVFIICIIKLFDYVNDEFILKEDITNIIKNLDVFNETSKKELLASTANIEVQLIKKFLKRINDKQFIDSIKELLKKLTGLFELYKIVKETTNDIGTNCTASGEYTFRKDNNYGDNCLIEFFKKYLKYKNKYINYKMHLTN